MSMFKKFQITKSKSQTISNIKIPMFKTNLSFSEAFFVNAFLKGLKTALPKKLLF